MTTTAPVRTPPPDEGGTGPGSRRGVVAWLRLLVGLGSALVGLGAAAALVLGHLGGERWTLERLADLRPLFLLVVLVAVAGLVVARWRVAAVVLGVVAVVGAWTVAPLWIGSPAPAVEGGPELRIAALNLSRRGDIDAFAAHLRDERPADVVIVVESSTSVIERFRRGDTGYEVVFPLPGGWSRTAVLSRVPARLIGPVELSDETSPEAVAFEVSLGDRPVRVLGAHPRSPQRPGRAAVRNDELRRIGAWARAGEGPVVVMGDLNVTPWAPAFGIVTDDAGLVDSSPGYGLQPTWGLEGSPLAFPIDHLLHSPSLTTTSRRTGPGFGSDHAMVLATLALAEE